MLAALEQQKAVQNQTQQVLEKEIVRQHQERAQMVESVSSVTRDRDEVRQEVQTMSQQLTQALKQIGDLTVQLNQQQSQTPVSQPVSTPIGTSRWPPYSSNLLWPGIPIQRDDPGTSFNWGPTPTQPIGTTMQMSGPSLGRTGTLHFTEPERQDAASERLSQYLDDQSSVAGFSCVAVGSSRQDV